MFDPNVLLSALLFTVSESTDEWVDRESRKSISLLFDMMCSHGSFGYHSFLLGIF